MFCVWSVKRTVLKLLQLVQNSAARLVTLTRKKAGAYYTDTYGPTLAPRTLQNYF